MLLMSFHCRFLGMPDMQRVLKLARKIVLFVISHWRRLDQIGRGNVIFVKWLFVKTVHNELRNTPVVNVLSEFVTYVIEKWSKNKLMRM